MQKTCEIKLNSVYRIFMPRKPRMTRNIRGHFFLSNELQHEQCMNIFLACDFMTWVTNHWNQACEIWDGDRSWTIYAGLFKMIVGVLTTCHTQYIWDKNMCFFLFNRTTLQVSVTYLIGGTYVHPLWFYKHQHDNRVRSKMFVARNNIHFRDTCGKRMFINLILDVTP